MWSRSRAQIDQEEYRVVRRYAQLAYKDTERSKLFLTNSPNPRKCWSPVKTAVITASFSLPPFVDRRVSWSGQQMRKPHCFWPTVTLNSTEIVFCLRILVTLLRYCVLSPSGLSLIVVCFWIWILMVEMILMECFYFFTSRWFGSWHLS